MVEPEYPSDIAKKKLGKPITDFSKEGESHRDRQRRYRARIKWLKEHPTGVVGGVGLCGGAEGAEKP